jgi:hypothetical protein
VRMLLEYFLQCYFKNCTKKVLQRVDLLHTELQLWGLNYQTPFYADCILRYRENCYKIHFSVDNCCNFKVISKSDILKQIYKGEE